MRFRVFALGLVACVSTEDAELGRSLRDFCDLVTEAASQNPGDRAKQSAHIAAQSSSAVSSRALMKLMRRLATTEQGQRQEVLSEAARKAGLNDFECPEILELYSGSNPNH